MHLPLPIVAALLTLAPLATLAAVARGPATVHPDHPSQCWLTGPSVALWPGQSHTQAPCTRIGCSNDTRTNSLYVEYATCGLLSVAPGCLTLKKEGAPYPECCPRGLCPRTLDRDFRSPEYEEFTDWLSQYYDYDIE